MSILDWFKSKPTTPTPTIKEKHSSHEASFAKGKVIRVFIPIRNFEGRTKSGELLGAYLQGRRYFLRENNFLLQELCNEWVSEKKIKWEDK